MKYQIFVFLFFIPMLALNAQPICTPETQFVDSPPGVYPLPYDPDINPEGGIDTPACPGQEYFFQFTVVVGDSITIPLGPSEIKVKLHHIKLDTEEAVQGLPEGVTYSCIPSNCTFRSQTLGCVALHGTVDEMNAAGAYPMVIHAEVTAELIGTIQLTFPGQFYPGEYVLDVLDPTDPYCTSAGKYPSRLALEFFPNPVVSGQVVRIQNVPGDVFHWTIFDNNGSIIEDMRNPAMERTEIDTEGYRSGIYFVKMVSKKGVHFGKLVVTDAP